MTMHDLAQQLATVEAERDSLHRQLAALKDGYTSLQTEFQLLRDLVEVNHPDLFARYLAGELAFEAR